MSTPTPTILATSTGIPAKKSRADAKLDAVMCSSLSSCAVDMLIGDGYMLVWSIVGSSTMR